MFIVLEQKLNRLVKRISDMFHSYTTHVPTLGLVNEDLDERRERERLQQEKEELRRQVEAAERRTRRYVELLDERNYITRPWGSWDV